MRRMFKASWHRIVSWTGIALVLLNVLVPTVSHALRAHDPAQRQAHRETVLAVAGDWCVSVGASIGAADLQLIERAVALQGTLAHLQACDFCDEAPLGAAMPLPVASGVDAPPQAAQAQRFAAFTATLARRPAFERPASRAPPQV
jgi:hypothetical protein